MNELVEQGKKLQGRREEMREEVVLGLRDVRKGLEGVKEEVENFTVTDGGQVRRRWADRHFYNFILWLSREDKIHHSR